MGAGAGDEGGQSSPLPPLFGAKIKKKLNI